MAGWGPWSQQAGARMVDQGSGLHQSRLKSPEMDGPGLPSWGAGACPAIQTFSNPNLEGLLGVTLSRY